MNANSIYRNAALSSHLYSIPVASLQVGMMVHAISEQTGKLGVKHKGKIKDLSIIERLSSCGIKSLLVEMPSPLKDKDGKDMAVKPGKANLPTMQSAHEYGLTQGELVFTDATNLLDKSSVIYAKFVDQLTQNQTVSFTETKELISAIYDNLISNPNALLCMSMIMQASSYIANHAVHVATLMCHFAHHLSYSRAECEQLALVGYLFDIGMVKVPVEVRDKKGLFDDIERAEMQSHVSHSLDIVAPLNLNREYMLAIEQHHERLDGTGYPHGYFGLKIHKFSRMLAIVDCYDALTSKRPHQSPMSPAAAMQVLRNPDFSYDQKLALQFIRCMGIYPVGSLVLLSNKYVGLVIEIHKEAPDQPKVKVFYNTNGNHFVPPKIIDLLPAKNSKSSEHKELRVLKHVLASQFGFDMDEILEPTLPA
jgi:HD-GYP domain-containing protein (c-di-GMP phosphodiesterase class II)